MKVVILQSNYIPWKGYFDLIHKADLFIYYDEVKYTKNDWRNRNRIYTKNGLQWISIPIAADAVKKKISEVTVLDKKWQELHFKSLTMGYKSARYFSQLEPLIHTIYRDHEWEKLIDIDRFCIEKISEFLGIKTRFMDSSGLNLEGDRIDRLLNVLKQVDATEYITGPSARNYLQGSEQFFADNQITLTYMDYHYPEYKQMSEPFEHGVSILDLIANIELSEIKQYIWANR